MYMISFNLNNIDETNIRTISLRIIDSYFNEFNDFIKSFYDMDLQAIYENKPKSNTTEKPRNHELIKGLPHFSYLPIHFKLLTIKICGDIDREIFKSIFNIDTLKPNTKTLWYPERPTDYKPRGTIRSNTIFKTKYPIYIISKGRYKTRYTEKSFKEMNCPYFLVVEEDEYELYKQHGAQNLLMFSNQDKKYFQSGIYQNDAGSIPVRNFIWKHSIKNGHKKHWCIDDNINGFCSFNYNKREPLKSIVGFRAIEVFSDRYKNLKMSGMNYRSFMPEVENKKPPILLNTRIYSCILLSNDTNTIMNDEWKGDYLWRGVYNEDTDLSLRILKSGYPTALFNYFLCNKMTTMSVKGGNTTSIYQNGGLQKKLDSLINQHPDVTKPTFRFKKIHHYVNYKPFKNIKLIEDENNIEEKIDWGIFIET